MKNRRLRESIDNLSQAIMEVSTVKITCVLKGFIENSADEKFKLNIFRIVQEGLNNILKHAHATEVTIILSQNKKSIILSISDNGVGFDTTVKNKGIGVSDIISRAESYKGHANFISRPGEGCSLIVGFPVETS
jgi:signal transduction histidine kinase